MALNDRDYNRMAKVIVSDTLCGQCSLNDGVIKQADANGLNPNETRRLIEHANTLAHLELFEKQAGDKYVTFEVAEPSVVLGALFETALDTETGAPTTMKCAMDAADRLPDEHGGVLYFAKEASAAPAPIAEHDFDSPYAPVRSLRPHYERVKHAAITEMLEDKLRQAHMRLTRGIRKIAEDLRRIDAPPFEKLAEECLAARHDAGTVYVLRKLGACRGQSLDPDTIKVAQYGVTTPWTKRVAELSDLYDEGRRLSRAYTHHTANAS